MRPRSPEVRQDQRAGQLPAARPALPAVAVAARVIDTGWRWPRSFASARQQHQQEQVEEQRDAGDDAPGEQRVAHRQWGHRRSVERPTGAAFERQQEFFGSFEALRGIPGDGLEHDVFEPAGDVRAIARRGHRFSEFRMLERLDLTVGILAGQQMVERDAGGVEVVRRADLVAGEQFRCHEARRSRVAGRWTRLPTD
jgi:hypothetical protein